MKSTRTALASHPRAPGADRRSPKQAAAHRAGRVRWRRRVVYQPLVNLQTMDVVGAEALTRFDGRGATDRTVGSLIRSLERDGSIVEHGRWLLARCAYDWWKVAPRMGRLNLNVSAVELNRRDYADELLRWYPRGGVALELTETSSVPLSDSGLRNLDRLAERGIPLVLDDLGDGYNSVHRMTKLGSMEVKLSRRWSAGIGTDALAEERLSDLLDRLLDLGRCVTVEGIESVEQLDWVRHRGVQIGQGFAVATPRPIDELRAWRPVGSSGCDAEEM